VNSRLDFLSAESIFRARVTCVQSLKSNAPLSQKILTARCCHTAGISNFKTGPVRIGLIRVTIRTYEHQTHMKLYSVKDVN